MDNQKLTKAIARISISSNGIQANGQSGSGSISDDGRFIPLESNATNLVTTDINGQTDTFIYDRLNQTVELISLAPDGTQADGSSSSGSISGNGNYVTFASSAKNLVSGDINGQRDIFLYDRLAKKNQLVSVASDGTQANGLSLFSAVNDDGKYVAFESAATNLVLGDTNGKSDIFLFDRINRTTTRINLGVNGVQANGVTTLGSISDDGNYISFTSEASNLVPDDINGKSDVFIYDLVKQTVELVSKTSVAANGNSSSSSISGNGNFVVYQSDASNLVSGDTNGKSDIFLYNRLNKTTELVDLAADGTQSNGNSRDATISDDGNIVAFLSDASNLVPGNNPKSNIFIRDRQAKTTKRLNVDSFPTLSGDAQSLIFTSSADDLVASDTNSTGDVFLADLNKFEDTINFATEDVHRFYQFEKGFHLYTSDRKEIDFVKQQSAAGELAYDYEAEKFSVLSDNKDTFTGETLEGVKPVYRFFNTGTGSHLYTTDEREKSFIEDNLSNYNSEGIKYYAFESAPVGIETIPVFRMLNTTSGSHLYTIDQKEFNFIQENLPNFVVENNGDAVYHVFEL